MTAQQRKFVSGLNYYVPAMQAGANLGQLLDNRISFGAPAVAATAANDISTGNAANTAATTTVAATATSAEPWGRNVAVKASGATGATISITAYGRDYLGQFMRETLAIANGDGTTTIQGVKAFKYIDKIVHDGAASNAVTFAMGWGTKLGLPYVTKAVEREYADGVVAAAGTLVAGVRTDPQTITTVDPRGTYVPTTTLNGAKVIEIDVQFDNYVNASNRGGLHGIPHFAG